METLPMKPITHTIDNHTFSAIRRATLDTNGNPLYYVYPENLQGTLPKIGYRRNLKQNYYLVQSYNIEYDLQHLAQLYVNTVNANATVRWIDLHDDNESRTGTLQEAREWLIDFWEWNPDDDMTEEEQARIPKRIKTAHLDELNDMFQGIGWYIETNTNTNTNTKGANDHDNN